MVLYSVSYVCLRRQILYLKQGDAGMHINAELFQLWDSFVTTFALNVHA